MTPRWARPLPLERPRLGPLRALRWPLVVLLLGGVGLAGARASESWQATARLARQVGRGPVSTGQVRIDGFAQLERHLSMAQVGATLGIGVVFLVWWGVAYRNLSAMGVRSRGTPRWAVGSWFVPIVGLVTPKRVAEELFRGSDADTPLGWSYGRGTASSLVTRWWVCWVASLALPPTAVALVIAVVRTRADLLGPAALALGAAFVLSAFLLGLAGLGAMALVIEVTASQIRRARALEEAGLLAPAGLTGLA